jgi:CheY-like chemotaxis protein
MHEHRVLVVEDEPFARRALCALLERHGWAARAAGGVGEALAALEAGPDPECVVLDLMLPDGAGEAVLRRLREAGSGARVVISTATADPGRLDAVWRLGPAATLSKPIDLAVLLATLAGRDAAAG